jgi:NAD(P)H-dependent FMN reductase
MPRYSAPRRGWRPQRCKSSRYRESASYHSLTRISSIIVQCRLPPIRPKLHRRTHFLIASPEYAHGVTGTIKNALDWLVSFEPFVDKPVAVLNTSPRAHHADDALRETLKTMSAVVVEQASITVPLLGAHLTEDGIIEDPTISRATRGALEALYSFFVLHKYEQSPQ